MQAEWVGDRVERVEVHLVFVDRVGHLFGAAVSGWSTRLAGCKEDGPDYKDDVTVQ